MSEMLELKVQKRTGRGKGPARRLRVKGFVPGVFYNAQGDNEPIQVLELPLRKVYEKTGRNQVFNLVIEDNGATVTKPALFWKLLNHPFKRQVEHVDFYGVDLEKEVTVWVPVILKGEPKGVKAGGRMEFLHEKLEITCLPLNIPSEIVIDVTGLDINQGVHVEDLPLAEGVKVVHEHNFSIVSVTLRVDEEEEEGKEGEA
ncbi:MAG: 50S ribosomal protein L25 [Desulfovibrionaceae bacterium]